MLLTSGCGGPKYDKPFKEFLGIKLAESAPIRLGSVSVEELSGGKIEAVFSFSGDYVVTDDLYLRMPPLSLEKGKAIVKKLADRGVPFDALMTPELKRTGDIVDEVGRVPILKTATIKGKTGRLNGRAKAQLNNDGSWSFQILDVTGATLEGERPPSGEWVLTGSAEEKALKDKLDSAFDQMESLGQKVLMEFEAKAAFETKKKAEEDKRIADEAKRAAENARVAAEKNAIAAKAREEVLLAAIANGKTYYGVWQGANSRGELGIRFGEGLKVGREYSLTGSLFDPENPQIAKPFSAVTSGNGTAEAPFVIEIKMTDGTGIVVPRETYGGGRETNLGLLNKSVRLTLPLEFSSTDLSFSGELKSSYKFNYQVRGPVKFIFRKDYTPNKKTGTSSAVPSGDTNVVTNVQLKPDDTAPSANSQGQPERPKRFTQEETIKLRMETHDAFGSFLDAMRRHDAATGRKILSGMKRAHPNSPNSYQAEIYMATMEKSLPRLKAAYKSYKEMFSPDAADAEMTEKLYIAGLDYIKRFPGPPII